MSQGSRRDPTGQRRRQARPAGEDETLWKRVTETVRPVKQMKPRVPDRDAATAPIAGPAAPERQPSPLVSGVRAAEKGAKKNVAGAAPRPSPAGPPAAKPAPAGRPAAAPPGLPAFERRQARRVATGRIAIEARLDLHGMTQAAAHAQLLAFLLRAVAAELKTVLVITGTGRQTRPSVAARGVERGHEEPGVLRRNLPRWLEEPQLRPLIVAVTRADRGHGGDGAFYIQLRRRSRRDHR